MIKEIDIEQIHFADWNPKEVGDRELIEKLKNSIKFQGTPGVLLVRQVKDGYEVIDGNHRLIALKELGYKKVICEDLGEISDSKAYVIFWQRNKEWFEIDYTKLLGLYQDVILQDFSIEDLSTMLPEAKEDLEVFAGEQIIEPFLNEEEKEESDFITLKINIKRELYEFLIYNSTKLKITIDDYINNLIEKAKRSDL